MRRAYLVVGDELAEGRVRHLVGAKELVGAARRVDEVVFVAVGPAVRDGVARDALAHAHQERSGPRVGEQRLRPRARDDPCRRTR